MNYKHGIKSGIDYENVIIDYGEVKKNHITKSQSKNWSDGKHYGLKRNRLLVKKVNQYNKRDLYKFLDSSEFEKVIIAFLKQRTHTIEKRKRLSRTKLLSTKNPTESLLYRICDKEVKMILEKDKRLNRMSYQKKYIYRIPNRETVYNNDYIDEYLPDAINHARLYIIQSIYDNELPILIRKSCWKALNYINLLRHSVSMESIESVPLEKLGYSERNYETQDDFIKSLMKSLNPEQHKIVNYISQGLTQRQIAEKMKISRRKLNYKLSELRQFAKKLSMEF